MAWSIPEGLTHIILILITVLISLYFYMTRKSLVESERRLKNQISYLNTLLESMNEVFFTYDPQARITFANRKTEGLTGYKPEELLGKSVLDFVDEGDRDKVLEGIRTRVEKGEPGSCETRALHKDGGIKYVRLNVSPIVESGAIIGGMVLAEDNTERKKAEEDLKQFQEHANFLANALECSSQPFVAGYPDGRIITCNRALCELTGYSREELLQINFYDLTPSEWHDNEARVLEELGRTGQPQRYEREILDREGRRIPVEVLVHLASKPDGDARYYYAFISDIFERKAAEEKLRGAHRQLLNIIEFLPDATMVVDRERKVIAWNRAMEEMTGIRKEDMLYRGDYAYAVPFYGRPVTMLIDLFFTEQEDFGREYEYFEKKGSSICAEVFVPSINDGKGAYLWGTASALLDENGELVGAIESIRDITERKRLEKQLKYLATHDSLTNIPNRYYLKETLKRVVAKARRGYDSALLLIDLDNFKLVNDTRGHAAGDDLLVNVVSVLKSNIREGDLLARLGGDEFAVLLEGAGPEQAGIVAEKLRQAVDESRIHLFGSSFNLSISIGIVMIDGATDPQKLLYLADTALYEAKEGGRNRYVLVNSREENETRLSENDQLVNLIRRAVTEGLFSLLYQPVLGMRDRRIAHHEALVRLQDEAGGLISPRAFIPVAERYGLMPQVDGWVVRASLETLRKYRDIKLFVNLSRVSLGDESLLEFIESSIRESGIDPCRLGFEVKEIVVVKNLALAERWIHRFKNLGCQLALDDFGVGFSSYSHLSMLPVDYLKIDGSFVRNLDCEPTHRALVQAMNAVTHTLGKKTIAGFVENGEVLRILHELQVDCGQGYYLGRPGPVPVSNSRG